MLKSIGVVAGSYVLSIILVLLTDPLLSSLFPGQYVKGSVPGTAPLVVSTAFFIVISAFCAWVCARFSGDRAATHVLWFFLIGEVLGIATTIPQWSKGFPHWYYLCWLLSWPVTCWLGLRLGARKNAASAAQAA
ncbi:MAG: hypothetical protein JO041_10005 [Acidobacteria bacterium]|nr:hypothetical protein [Acidobacteriota bacterium]